MKIKYIPEKEEERYLCDGNFKVSWRNPNHTPMKYELGVYNDTRIIVKRKKKTKAELKKIDLDIFNKIKKMLTPKLGYKSRGWWIFTREIPYIKEGIPSFLPVNKYGKKNTIEEGEIGMMFGKKVILK